MVDQIKTSGQCTIWQEKRESIGMYPDPMMAGYNKQDAYFVETCLCPGEELPDTGFAGFLKSIFMNYIGHGWKDTGVVCGAKDAVETKTTQERSTSYYSKAIDNCMSDEDGSYASCLWLIQITNPQ